MMTMDEYPLSIFFCLFYPPLNMKGRVSNMSEAIISRRGNKSISKSLSTEVITTNTQWIVPTIKGNVHVMIYGAGGGGFTDYTAAHTYYPTSNRNKPYGSGGGGGWMNNGEFELDQGSIISITIGKGGNYTTYGINSGAGGTTAFGTYLSANGGSSIIFDEFNKWGGGGDGGSGGGCGYNVFSDIGQVEYGIGGTGYQFGGGGGIGTYYVDFNRNCSNGGPYGGGGGTGYVIKQSYNNINPSVKRNSIYRYGSKYSGVGGIYGGDGGYVNSNNRIISSKNGTNTIGNESIQSSLQGSGSCGTTKNYTNYGNTGYSFGGGGGFGGCGGNGSDPAYHWFNINSFSYNNGSSFWVWINTSVWVGTGGGGGGYGGNGGSGGDRGAGGGGGYIGNGGNGGNCFGGGGGGYGDGGEFGKAPGYGGGGCYLNAGGNGICIIQYYI